MPVTGPPSHLDISVGDSAQAIRFYDALLRGLGYRRFRVDMEGFTGEAPARATWGVKMEGGAWFSIEVRPADPGKLRRYDRYEPGPHHLAFHAESPAKVDAVHAAMVAAGAEVLDPPEDYSGREGYNDGYYAAFYADPDGVKLEVVYEPTSNP